MCKSKGEGVWGLASRAFLVFCGGMGGDNPFPSIFLIVKPTSFLLFHIEPISPIFLYVTTSQKTLPQPLLFLSSIFYTFRIV